MLQFDERFVITSLKADSFQDVIHQLAGRLHQANLVDEKYGQATVARELEHPTGLPTRPFPIAFPHADADGVIESALAVGFLAHPVSFKNMADPDQELDVEIVIMLANKSPEEQINTLRSLAELFGESEKLSDLRSLSDPEQITKWMKQELELE